MKNWTYFKIKRNGQWEYKKTQGRVGENVWVNEKSGNVYLKFDASMIYVPARYPSFIYKRVPEKVANLAKIVK